MDKKVRQNLAATANDFALVIESYARNNGLWLEDEPRSGGENPTVTALRTKYLEEIAAYTPAELEEIPDGPFGGLARARLHAMKDLGFWGDACRREKALEAYEKYDNEIRAKLKALS